MTEGIFSALSKLSPLATENQLTESLVYLLRALLERCPREGLRLANALCGLTEGDGFADTLEIATQVSTSLGTPDIRLSDGHTLAFVEVKHDSPLAPGQLEAYAQALAQSGYSRSRLVLLTRSRAWCQGTRLAAGDYYSVCWYEVHAWLAALDLEDEVAQYLVDSFLAFLQVKGMSMGKVTWEYIEGVPAMLRLTDMLEAAITDALRVTFRRTAGWNWRGYFMPNKLFFGVRYEQPMTVVCEDNRGYPPVTFKRDLNLEAAHFFSLSEGEQLELLAEFVRAAWEEAHLRD